MEKIYLFTWGILGICVSNKRIRSDSSDDTIGRTKWVLGGKTSDRSHWSKLDTHVLPVEFSSSVSGSLVPVSADQALSGVDALTRPNCRVKMPSLLDNFCFGLLSSVKSCASGVSVRRRKVGCSWAMCEQWPGPPDPGKRYETLTPQPGFHPERFPARRKRGKMSRTQKFQLAGSWFLLKFDPHLWKAFFVCLAGPFRQVEFANPLSSQIGFPHAPTWAWTHAHEFLSCVFVLIYTGRILKWLSGLPWGKFS